MTTTSDLTTHDIPRGRATAHPLPEGVAVVTGNPPSKRRAYAREAAQYLFKPVDAAWLVAFRVLFGLTLFVSMLRFIAYGWIDTFFVNPRFHFSYLGFDWVEPLSRDGMYGLFWTLAALALCIASGLLFRVACGLFFLGFSYLQLIDVATYLNHYYLAALLCGLLALSPAHRLGSLDARLGWTTRRHTVSRLWLYLFRFQIGVVYTFAGLAKAHSDWLLSAQPLSIWLSSKTELPVLGLLFSQPWAAPVMSWAGFLFDTFIIWALLSRRLRPFAYAVVIVFHTLTRLLFPIGMFPVIMTLSALVFFSPSWPTVLLGRFRHAWQRLSSRFKQERVSLPGFKAPPKAPLKVEAASPTSTAARGQLTRARSFGLAICAVYCLLQVALPLRTHLYGGNVLWHEQGMRFSWRVMVREKNGSITFIVHNPQTGKVWHVSPRRYLTRIQEREMSSQPDLILQLAHHIRDDFERSGRGPVEVHVDALVSLNGRRIHRLIDPEVDLASVSDGLDKASWILPAPTTPPPRITPI